jgi:hypothetical protein
MTVRKRFRLSRTKSPPETDESFLNAGGRNAGERAAAAARRHEAARLDVSLRVHSKAPSAHTIVSEMMILAGELVGTFGAANGLPLPYRGQARSRRG